MTGDNGSDILVVDGLTVAYRQEERWLDALRDFSLQLESGTTYGLVGESGSGKTTAALAIMRYLGKSGRVRSGRIEFDGQELTSLDETAMRKIWGAKMSLVPQDPLSSLNPSLSIGEQLDEPLRHHMNMGRRQAASRALELLESVRIEAPERVYQSYPHQISGGMQQRVMIAMALSTEPRLLILDEPTTALDVTTQAAILDLFRDLIRQRETAVLYVTHNLGVVSRICDRVAVLYAGELVEDAAIGDLFRRPLHPYTHGLLASIPRLGASKAEVRLQAIPGQIPPLGERPEACIFAPRCPLAIDICRDQRPQLETVDESRRIRCHRWQEINAGEITVQMTAPDRQRSRASLDHQGESTVLEVEDLSVTFNLRRTLFEILSRKPAAELVAVDGVDLSIARGRTLGLVGESGSGKTTLARAIIGLEKDVSGRMRSLGFRLPPGLSKRSKKMMHQMQIVFQSPEEALNPYSGVSRTLRRPLQVLAKLPKVEADKMVARLLEDVNLPASYAQRRPDQLSGGEKQRVAIARAFAADPDLLLADEPVSSLDVSVQASILNLLNDLQAEHNSSTLFISHDLTVVGYLADDIVVIYSGEVMEYAPAADLFKPPHHPYTEALLSAIPHIDPEAVQEPIRLEADLLDVPEASAGCPFHPRCPRYRRMKDELGDLCPSQVPPWRETETGKRIFCHIPLDQLIALQEPS